jgi:redox-sensitive bicupin YhaK (pirin superfamily)
LKSFHSFSFANYYDPAHMGWGNLRVINEDRVAAGAGFGTHGHRDMEIISYVVSGELAHQDSMGNGTRIPSGDVQRLSAGRGITHSEYNHSKQQSAHFFQIWIEPTDKGIAPSYEQKHFSETQKRGALCLVASPDGAEGSVRLHADAAIYTGLLTQGQRVDLPLNPQRKAYVHVVHGKISVNGVVLQGGDAALLDQESSLNLTDAQDAEVLVFDLSY